MLCLLEKLPSPSPVNSRDAQKTELSIKKQVGPLHSIANVLGCGSESAALYHSGGIKTRNVCWKNCTGSGTEFR